MNKIMMVVCAASLLLVACGDDGSTSAKGGHGDSPYCTVKKTGDGATQEIYEPGEGWGESGVKFKGGKVVLFANMTFEMSAEEIEEKCEELEENADMYDKGSFTCGKNGASYTMTFSDDETFSLNEILQSMKDDCVELKEEWAGKFGDEEYGSDNDEENSSSSKKKSSSSTKGKSSSSSKSDGVKVSGSEKYNAITDKRDGKKYRVEKIGSRVWFLDNLAFEGTDEYPLAGRVDVYNRSDNGVQVVLYNFAAAMNDDKCANSVCNGGGYVVQGACPDGWAVPSDWAWSDLSADLSEYMSYAEFFSQPTGESGPEWIDEDNISRYWSTLENGASGAYEWYYITGGGVLSGNLLTQSYSKNYGYGVRCVAVDDVVLDAYVESPVIESSSSGPFGGSSSSSEFDLCDFLDNCESSSSEDDVSSSSFNMDTTFATGEFVDERDGETYGYIDYYGVQWMSENLRFSDSSLVHELEESTWCIGEDGELCEQGMLYTFDAAQKACPDGWKLPNLEDWESLAYYGDGGLFYMYDIVKDQMNVDSTGEYGISVAKMDEYARFWTSQADGANGGFMVYLKVPTLVFDYQGYDRRVGYAVRCIKD
ncbi:MAG: hypothetical protein MJY99_05040 [Fibrobacter sp.]|nr:hypothetical protein [Fibrobacter sp.]